MALSLFLASSLSLLPSIEVIKTQFSFPLLSFFLACDSTCNTGLRRCVGSQTNCCPYFSQTDQCTTQCPTNLNASASNGFICSKCKATHYIVQLYCVVLV